MEGLHQALVAGCQQAVSRVASSAMNIFGETSLKPIEQRTIPARRPLFLSDEALPGIPMICAGWAAVIGGNNNHRRQILDFLLPDDPVSSSLVFVDRFNFMVEAVTEVTYCCFNRQEFRQAMDRKPNLLDTVLDNWQEETLQLKGLAVSLGINSAEERIAQLMVMLCERLNRRGRVHGGRFDFPLRQQHIAEYSGLTAVHVSKVIGRLRQQELIDMQNRSLVIRDIRALRRLCRN